MKHDVIGLGEAHDKHAVDDSKPHEILSQHTIDHDHHRTNKFESSAEEKEVETVGEHDELPNSVLSLVHAEHPERNTELEQDAGEQEADTRGAELHILQEYLVAQEAEFSHSLQNE